MKENNRVSVIDLGTNTFNLLIAEPKEAGFEIIHKEQVVVKIGKDGISKGFITEEAQQRLLDALITIKQTLELYRVSENKLWAAATSAFRSAKNAKKIVAEIERKTGIRVEIISGEQEATYIYEGVKYAMNIGEENVMVMDIGGGSVEFIICSQRKILWKKSFDIGAQRLMDQFMRTDPISELDIQRLEIYLEMQLFDLSNAIFNYSPKLLIGSAGAFDTFAQIAYIKEFGKENLDEFADENAELKVANYEITRDEFHYIYQDIIRYERTRRIEIPGMIEFRVDMIVLAACLLKFIIEKYELETICVSAYSLKEGFLLHKLD